METDFAAILRAFLPEALKLLGARELGIAAGLIAVLVAAIGWAVARLIDRKEAHVGAAISAGLTFVLVGGVLGATFITLQLKDLCDSGTATGNFGFTLCAGICGIMTLAMVHGAFGTAWWRSVIMLPVLAGAALGAGWISHKFILDGRATQLPVLAAQVAGLKTESPSLITTEPLKKIAAQYGIRAERAELTQRQEQLVKTYQVLQDKRARLNAADQPSVAAFNQLVNAYVTENAYLTKRRAELDALAKPATIAASAQ
jgi:hypothetical protein